MSALSACMIVLYFYRVASTVNDIPAIANERDHNLTLHKFNLAFDALKSPQEKQRFLKTQFDKELLQNPVRACHIANTINGTFPSMNDMERNLRALANWHELPSPKDVGNASTLMDTMEWNRFSVEDSIKATCSDDRSIVNAAHLYLLHYSGGDLSKITPIKFRRGSGTSLLSVKLAEVLRRTGNEIPTLTPEELEYNVVPRKLVVALAIGKSIPADRFGNVLDGQELWLEFVKSSLAYPLQKRKVLLHWLAQTGALSSSPKQNIDALTTIVSRNATEDLALFQELAQKGAVAREEREKRERL